MNRFLENTGVALVLVGFLAAALLFGAVTAIYWVAIPVYAMLSEAAKYAQRRPVVSLFSIWGLCLATWVTLRVFGDNPPVVPTGTAAAYATLFILPPLVVKFMQWAVDKAHKALEATHGPD